MSRTRRAGTAAVLAVFVMLWTPPLTARASNATATGSHLPVYAYFYQWFEKGSWDRAKKDLPAVGKYSSDDPHVLRAQIQEARSVGIDGFLTSWKSTGPLNRRLELLVQMATDTHFDVSVVYEALDFQRNPLPIAKVSADLELLVRRWGPSMHTAFGRPVIIWTGTNQYTHAQIASVHALLAGRAYLLAASKSVAAYDQISDVVDGEAYYWSSANPRSPSTAAKLNDMSAAVHASGGLWIAPAAPGFDGSTLGHTRVIDRNGGATFDRSLAIAAGSSPDALGVISWNEWSENTYIEAGRRYRGQELTTLRDYLVAHNGVNRTTLPTHSDQSSSAWTGLRAAAMLVLLTSIGVVVLVIVGRRPARSAGRRNVRRPRHVSQRHEASSGRTR
ncbi:MAG: hypothetical protein ACRDVG_06960 [Jatrophihabitantaceae bacterium]